MKTLAGDDTVSWFDPARSVYQPLTVTPAALAYLQRKLAEHGHGNGLRLSIKRAGCSGLEYVVDYANAAYVGDTTYAITPEFAVYVPAADLPYVHGTAIDYLQKGIAGGELKFNNPNATVSCGCGESFNIV